MVATRSRGKATGDAAAASALKAPPKRAGKRKAVEDLAAPTEAMPSQKPTKKTKTAAEAPSASTEKPATRTTRRAAKAVEEPRVEEVEAPKRAKPATRGRKTAAPADPAELVKQEEGMEEPAVEEPVKKTTRARKAPVKAAKSVAAKSAKVTVAAPVPDISAAPKRATRASKVTVSIAPPAANTEVTESPLKKPARKPAKKPTTRKPVSKPAVESQPAATPAEEPFTEFPNYPDTPGHITAPISGRDALKELPAGYPKTPAHIKAPISSRDALQELPAGYPKTPAHIAAPISSRDALKELPAEYPKTPAHISAPITSRDALRELPAGYPKTPAHITAPISSGAALKELPAGYPDTPAHIVVPSEQPQQQSPLQENVSSEPFPTSFSVPDSSDDEEEDQNENIGKPSAVDVPSSHTVTPAKISGSPKTPVQTTPVQSEEAMQAMLNQEALEELPAEYPRTPAHVVEAYGNQKAFDQLPEYPKTPGHIVEAYGNQKALNELPGYPKTPAHIASAHKNQKAFNELAAEYPSTPDQFVDAFGNQQAFKQLAEYPQTPAHIAAPVSTREALKELPVGYPTTPAHIMTIKQGLDQLPSYPNTPAPNNGANSPVQVESTSKLSSDNESEEFESALEADESDLMQLDDDDTITSAIPKEQLKIIGSTSLAPTLLPPTLGVPASPTKSALRSPLKNSAKTPKKTVTWGEDYEAEDDDYFGYSGLLRGTRFLVDVTTKGEDQGFYFVTLLQEMGAQVFRDWTETTSLTHVIFKDGSKETIDKVVASNGTVKCINTGWLVAMEQTKKRVDETDYLVDLATATVCTPVTRAPRRRDFFAPAKTPTRFLNNMESGSATKSVEDMPSTPTSSDFDRSIASIEDKENNFEDSAFLQKFSLSVPAKKSWRISKDQVKTPTKAGSLFHTPARGMTFSQRPVKSSLFGQTPVKNSLFSQPPVKAPSLFGTTPKGPSSLFGQAPSKPSSLDHTTQAASKLDGSSEPDTWFDQQAKKKSSLLGQGPVKPSSSLSQKPVTSGRFSALVKGMPSTPTANRQAPPINFLSTTKKRTATQSFGGSITTPAKKFRGFF